MNDKLKDPPRQTRDPARASARTIVKGETNIPVLTTPVAEKAVARDPVRPPALQIGSVINRRFELTRKLGEGGMSMVFQALDRRKAEAKDRDPYIAIKILSGEFSRHPQAIIALERETRKSQTLAHPNIITVYDFDRDGRTMYMTMEQLHGQSLHELIRKNRKGLPPETVTPIIEQICEGLRYAHSKHIIHADLKPSNIFITEKGVIKILDFGIARANSTMLQESADHKTLFDAAKLGGLTPSYASYEMFANLPPEPSDDIYSLGLIFYELLTGLHPYQRQPAPVARSQGLKPAPINSIKRYQWRAIEGALSLDRSERLKTIEEFAKRYSSRRKKRVITSIAATIVLATAGLSWISAQSMSQNQPNLPFDQLPSQTRFQVENALKSANEALQFNDLNGALTYFDQAGSLHPGNTEVRKGLNTIVDQVLSSEQNPGQTFGQSRLDQINILLAYPALADHPRLHEVKQQLQSSFD